MKLVRRRLVSVDVPGYRYQYVTREKSVTPQNVWARLTELLEICSGFHEHYAVLTAELERSAEDVRGRSIDGQKFFGPLSICVGPIDYFK